MAPVDLDRPAVLSLRPALGQGRIVTVFAGTYGRALMVLAALPFPLRDRASIEVLGEAAATGTDGWAAA
jgi:hypothetical protein